MLQQLLRTKTIEQLKASVDEPGHGHLKRALSAWDLTLLGVGAIIGAGILSSLGTGLAGGFDSSYGVTRPARGTGAHRELHPHGHRVRLHGASATRRWPR